MASQTQLPPKLSMTFSFTFHFITYSLHLKFFKIKTVDTVTCGAVSTQRPRDGWIYQGRFCATAR
jgi:hypothetical protein